VKNLILKSISRREFLKITGMLAGAAFLTASPVPPSLLPTVAVNDTKPRLRDLADQLGIETGISLRTIDRWKFGQYLEYINSILQFSLIKDGYTNSPDSWMDDLNVYEYLTQLSRFAKKNQMGLSIDNLFNWDWFNPPHKSAYLYNGTKEQLDEFLQDMVRKHFEVPYFTDLTFASEPTGSDQDDNPYWNDCPLLRIYGHDWPEMAYHLAWEEAQRTGRKVGEKLSFVYAVGGMVEVPKSRHADYEYKHLSELKKKLSDNLGIERPFAIGMEYHIHHGAMQNPSNGCWGPAAQQLKKADLIEHFQRFNEIGDMMINECSITGTDDPEQKKETLHILLEAAIESKVVKRVLFWTPFFQPSGDTHNDEYEMTCDQTGMFTENYTLDYLFEEMYKIFESYQTK
jgi:hypothetical protein